MENQSLRHKIRCHNWNETLIKLKYQKINQIKNTIKIKKAHKIKNIKNLNKIKISMDSNLKPIKIKIINFSYNRIIPFLTGTIPIQKTYKFSKTSKTHIWHPMKLKRIQKWTQCQVFCNGSVRKTLRITPKT